MLINLSFLTVLAIAIGITGAQQHVVLTGAQSGITNGTVPYRRDIRDLRADNTAW